MKKPYWCLVFEHEGHPLKYVGFRAAKSPVIPKLVDALRKRGLQAEVRVSEFLNRTFGILTTDAPYEELSGLLLDCFTTVARCVQTQGGTVESPRWIQTYTDADGRTWSQEIPAPLLWPEGRMTS